MLTLKKCYIYLDNVKRINIINLVAEANGDMNYYESLYNEALSITKAIVSYNYKHEFKAYTKIELLSLLIDEYHHAWLYSADKYNLLYVSPYTSNTN